MVRLPRPHTEFIHTSFDTKLNCALVKRSANSAKLSLACNCCYSGTVIHSSLFAHFNSVDATPGKVSESCILSFEMSADSLSSSQVFMYSLGKNRQKYDLIGEQIKFTGGQ